MTAVSTQVTSLLTQFGLTTAAGELVPRLTQAGCPEAMPVLVEVFEAEAEARRQRRVTRLRRASRLPPGKTFATLDTGRFPAKVTQQLETLATGAFLETATNVLAFGLPGVGKSHALSAVGHALVEAGRSVLCAPAYQSVAEVMLRPAGAVLGPRRVVQRSKSPKIRPIGAVSAPSPASSGAPRSFATGCYALVQELLGAKRGDPPAARRRAISGPAATPAAFSPAPARTLPARTVGEYFRPFWCGTKTRRRSAGRSTPARPHRPSRASARGALSGCCR